VTSIVWQAITQGAAATNEEKMYDVEAAQINSSVNESRSFGWRQRS
jgi:hypothetical protein